MSTESIDQIETPVEPSMQGMLGVIRDYLKQREIKERLAADLKACQTQIDILESQIVEQLGAQGLDSLKLDGYLLSRTIRNFSSIKADCKSAAIQAFQEMGYGDRVVTLNHQALGSLLNEWNDQGTMPEALAGMVQVYERQGLSVRKAR